MKKGIKTLIFFMITLIFILTLNIGTSGYLKYKDVDHNIGIEEKILELQEKKKMLSDKIIEGDARDKNNLGELTEKDLRNLLAYEQEENN